jgi:AbiJ N-terminal domain 4
MSFSERYGYKKARESLQLEAVDAPLRNGLWSVLELHAWKTARYSSGMYGGYYISPDSNKELYVLSLRLWLHYFKEPIDQLPRDWTKVLAKLRRHFFEGNWFEVYDFVEFVANNFEKHAFKDNFLRACNSRLEAEASAYRFIGTVITRITEPAEIQQIDETLASTDGPVRTHLARALELLSDRTAPDYRNSIKESISAVESLVAQETGSEKGTLGQLLKILEDQIQLHPALKSAFSSLYGYTSDASGIRHALLDVPSLRFEDAKFFLVICTAFITFVIAKRTPGA